MSFVAFEQRGPIGVLTMNRPEALNALNEQVLRDLDAALDAVAANDEVLVVILTGAGRSFVAGADIGQMKDLTPVQAKKFGSYGNQVFLKLENFPKPVIAAVNGFALGGGCELSMACDIRLASEKAKFGQPEVGLGITPGFGGTQRLARIVGNAERPVIFVFSGKAHPADTQGIDMLQEVIRHMLDPRFFGKIFFIEDYNLAVSRLMVQGCDVWLNTPRRPYEACGTSGQKVPVNAGVNLSISDGWWCEGYNGENGWTIGPAVTREYLCGEQSDYDDAGFLYALLEEKIVPLYFERNFEGMPHDWLLTVRQSMQSLIARFSSNRMVREYLNDYYIPAAQRYAELRDKHNALTKRLARWKQDVNARFSSLRIEQIRIEGLKGEELMGTQPMQVQIGVLPGGMKPEELLVQLVAGPGDGNGFTDTPDVVDMARTEESTADRLVYACAYSPSRSGPHVYGVRVLPVTPGLASPLETRLVLWG